MSIRSRNKPSTEFSTSSIADIVFLLLIYFLLTSTFVAQVGLKVDLPRSSSDKPSNAKNSVTITKEGVFAWNQSVMEDKADLEPLLKEVLTDEFPENDVVTLRTDKEVTMEETAFVMSIIAEYGGKVVILTRK
ncbi:MAG: biopolymer transporter ExbD [Bacteroidota bacterium]